MDTREKISKKVAVKLQEILTASILFHITLEFIFYDARASSLLQP